MSKTNKILIIIGSIIIFLVCVVPLAMGVLGNLIERFIPSTSTDHLISSGNQVSVNPGSEIMEEATKIPTPTPTEEPLRLEPDFLANGNALCFLHRSEALTCLDEQGWHIYTTDDFDYPLYLPTFITQCIDGRIFLHSGDLYLSENSILTEFKDFSHIATSLVCEPDGGLWIGHYEGVSYFDGNSWTTYDAKENFGSGEYVQLINGMAMAPNGDIWVITADSIVHFNGTTWQVFEAGQGFDEDPDPKDLAIDTNGNVWVISSYDKLLKYDGTKWTTFTSAKTMNKLVIDTENKIWVATDKGVAVFDPALANWTTQFGEETFLEDRVSALEFDGAGRLWAVTGYGLYVYDGSGWTGYHMHTAELFDNEADEIFVVGDGLNLPPLSQKEPGSVSGKLDNPDVDTYTNIQVEVCIHGVIIVFYGATPCSGQAYHTLATVNSDGSFLVSDIPAGKYELMVQLDSDTWLNSVSFEVFPGIETRLGLIDTTDQ